MPRRLWLIIGLLALLLALGGLWQWLAMGDVLTPGNLRQLLASTLVLRETIWAPLALMALYVVASLVVFPLTVLVGATGLIFGSWWGLAYALAGTMLASAVTYYAGRRLGRDALISHGGERVNKLANGLANRGIRTMIVFNLLPLAPFTLTNMLAGACRLRFGAYMIGSFIGIVPGLAAVTIAGSQLGSLIHSNSRDGLWISIAVIAMAVALLALLGHLARRRQAA
ncbi:TVP38/TMEM64 family protein [Larsenimonas rhizosphaerae]|uniref:TVP38/TMEM64 family membrane protein n=1 Tax=Larsenimonas rhizosphaerae TaxID=2944682 RepID=A0AA42CT26_9GAMM|nr:TVP38/TMEM64 family protein [Larsenimonas rhizosphaerae]MCM2129952.1 TVP38/TMEM64 family protein [Larsenimonas rhizosphaerae]MCX2522651.1 TVP38/TMEM64 family protein [Larsenimonas rhizosphaerae]